MKAAGGMYLAIVVAAACAQENGGFEDLARRASAALQQQPDQAAALYREALALRPSWAEGWFYLGASEYRLKHPKEARRALTRASELAPDNGAAWAFLGLTEADSGSAAEALAHIVKAERLGLPNNPQFIETVRLRAAAISVAASDFTAAIEQLRPLAMSGDQNAPVLEALGLASLTMRAVSAAKRPLVDLAGRAAWALYAQKWSDAEPLFRRLGEQYPKEPGVHYLRGIYLVDRDIDAAMSEFAAELKVSPSHAMARIQMAILHLRKGDAAAAVEPAREALAIEPQSLLGHLTLGRAYLDLGKTESAVGEFETAVKISPEYPHTHFYLSQAFRKAGKEEEARREQQEFTRLQAAGSPTAGAGPPQ